MVNLQRISHASGRYTHWRQQSPSFRVMPAWRPRITVRYNDNTGICKIAYRQKRNQVRNCRHQWGRFTVSAHRFGTPENL